MYVDLLNIYMICKKIWCGYLLQKQRQPWTSHKFKIHVKTLQATDDFPADFDKYWCIVMADFTVYTIDPILNGKINMKHHWNWHTPPEIQWP